MEVKAGYERDEVLWLGHYPLPLLLPLPLPLPIGHWPLPITHYTFHIIHYNPTGHIVRLVTTADEALSVGQASMPQIWHSEATIVVSKESSAHRRGLTLLLINKTNERIKIMLHSAGSTEAVKSGARASKNGLAA
ncbi:hypothetical protein ACLKA6_018379 [Drosophila palustris]